MRGLAELEKRMSSLEKRLSRTTSKHIQFNDDGSIILFKAEKNLIYTPSPTAVKFHESNDFVRLVMGPYGSGKTTMCLFEIVKRACQMPIWYNGRRRSKWLLIRNTSGELQSTTLQSWLSWFDELGDVNKRQKPILTYEHCFSDGNGLVELELIFLALDREDDVRKLKSLEVTGAYINEMSEVHPSVLSHLKGRLNSRYPSKQFCSVPYWSGVIADTNPPDVDHWIHDAFEKQNIEHFKIFKQPPGLVESEFGLVENLNHDNYKNLNKDYYEMLALGQTQEFINVFCLGRYGSVGTGKLVYPEFNSDLHAMDYIDVVDGLPLLLGWDFGLTPACAVCQLTPRGQLLVIYEFVGEDIGLQSFVESVVLTGLKQKFPLHTISQSYADPSGVARADHDEMSCISMLDNLGIKTEPASTNDIEARLNAVRYFMGRMSDGKPSFLVSKFNCPNIYKGLVKDYVYERLAVRGEARFRDKPTKGFCSHIQESLQYVCLELAATTIKTSKRKNIDVNDFWNPVARVM